MVFTFLLGWCFLGTALFQVGFWEGHLGKRSHGGISKVVNVLPLERKKCSLLLGERAAHNEVDVLIFQDIR